MIQEHSQESIDDSQIVRPEDPIEFPTYRETWDLWALVTIEAVALVISLYLVLFG